MPAYRIGSVPSSVSHWDVAGQDAASDEHFIGHIGLSIEQRDDLTFSSRVVHLAHMGPPLTRDADDDVESIDVVGSTNLTSDEQMRIETFVDELETEYESQKARAKRQYVIHPHFVEYDEDQYPFPRFNCGGFVVEAYREIDIDLIRTGDFSLPAVDLDTLIKAYPAQERRLRRQSFRELYGLTGDGPWPVLLAGYVIHAMDRDAEECRTERYQACRGDEYFPRLDA